ncbi:uncharacterized protein LOC142550694 [Primulina tabacum]|uniref:uncharacterized protein LOC142550694 n=1 Tax=Primulina tabacum TaxID=48773 RepID=UPI003F598393
MVTMIKFVLRYHYTTCGVFLLIVPMNIMVWNCQGAASKPTRRVIKDLRRKFKPSVLGLLEPRVSGSQADEICKKMGFENWARVESVGFSGGIWVLWEANICVNIVYTHPQFILFQVMVDDQYPWLLSIVYGSPNAILRKILWQDLTVENLNIEGPWCSVGDYNSVISDDEVSSRKRSAHHRNTDFSNWIFNQAMIDMGFEGAKFTWRRGLTPANYKGARLDRGVCNLEWKEMFPEAKSEHLPVIQSDHAPLLIKLKAKKSLQSRGMFRFQSAWLTHEDFSTTIAKEWDDKKNLKDNIVKMAHVMSDWNRSTFGNIHIKKRKLISRIMGIQRILAISPRRGLLKLRINLKKSLTWY